MRTYLDRAIPPSVDLPPTARVIDHRFRRLPTQVTVDARTRLMLVVPTGALRGLDRPDAGAIVEDAAWFHDPNAPSPFGVARARLVVLRDQRRVAMIPLVPGRWCALHEPDGAWLGSLRPLAWRIPVGALRGDDSADGVLRLAWQGPRVGAADWGGPTLPPARGSKP